MASAFVPYNLINPRVSPADVVIFSFEDPRFTETHVLTDSYCVQPSCPCRLVGLTLERLPDSIETREKHPDRFFLHLDTLELQDATGMPLEPTRHPRIAAFRAELPPEALALWRVHYDQGRKYGELNSWKHKHWDQLEPGDTIAYSEIRESAEVLVLPFEGGSMGVVERYCPSPACDCREVLLTFTPFSTGESLVEGELTPLVRLSFSGKYQVESEGSLTDEQLDGLMKGLLQRPAALRQLREHYGELKQVGRFLAERYPDLALGWGMKPVDRAIGAGQNPTGEAAAGSRTDGQTAPGRKVGRNEACPCGSGRKYKQCCGKV
jgi:hypothetical protein